MHRIMRPRTLRTPAQPHAHTHAIDLTIHPQLKYRGGWRACFVLCICIMSYFKGFGNNSNSYGQFWYGGNSFPGFLYKKNVGSGGKKNPKVGLICNKPTEFWNKYVPGAGVGASSVANRRAKLIHATACQQGQQCGRFYMELGQNQIRPSRYTTYNSNFTA